MSYKKFEIHDKTFYEIKVIIEINNWLVVRWKNGKIYLVHIGCQVLKDWKGWITGKETAIFLFPEGGICSCNQCPPDQIVFVGNIISL